MKFWNIFEITSLNVEIAYRIAGKFGRGKVWRIDSFRVFGEKKFDELVEVINCKY